MTKTERFRRVSKFELHDLIGEGAMGVVWKAYDTVIRRYVALKLLGTRIGKTGDARLRFLREARAAGVLQHPNLVTLYDLGEAENQLYIAMELVEGRDLSSLIATNEPLALERKLDIVIELLEGLAYAHERGVIHRDIKPSNVRVAADGRVKIMDFGIARLQSADVTGSGAIVGTPNYMAPEQVTNGPITPATDLFSVGCLLYELLSYRKPFEGETVHGVLYQVLTTDPKPLRTMAPSIPAGLERVVGKALNKVPEDRYQSARQMQHTLLGIRAALSGASDTTQRLSPRWTPIPLPLLRLITHTPLRWRVVVLSALATVVLALSYVSRGAVQPALLPPQAGGPFPGVTSDHPTDAPTALDQLLATRLPPRVNLALVALRQNDPGAAQKFWRGGSAPAEWAQRRTTCGRSSSRMRCSRRPRWPSAPGTRRGRRVATWGRCLSIARPARKRSSCGTSPGARSSGPRRSSKAWPRALRPPGRERRWHARNRSSRPWITPSRPSRRTMPSRWEWQPGSRRPVPSRPSRAPPSASCSSTSSAPSRASAWPTCDWCSRR